MLWFSFSFSHFKVVWDPVDSGFCLTLALGSGLARDSYTRLFHICSAPLREVLARSLFFFPSFLLPSFLPYSSRFSSLHYCALCSVAFSFARPLRPRPRWGEESCESTFGGLSPAGQSYMGLGSVPMEYVQMVSIVCHRCFAYGVRQGG